MSIRILLMLLITSSLTFYACSEDGSSSKISNTLPDVLEEVGQNSKLVGFTVSVIKDGAIDFRKSYGMAHAKEGMPYTSQTEQPVASVSKAFLAVALVKAIDAGYFTLETPINDILPFKVINPSFPAEPIRIKHLASHTSGIVDDVPLFFSTYKIFSGEDLTSTSAQMMLDELGVSDDEVPALPYILEAYFSEEGDFYDASHFSGNRPGTHYQYSNLAASLAAYLVELKSGTPFRTYVKENILLPLEMYNTAYMYEGITDSVDMADLYFTPIESFPRYASASYPSGSLASTNKDLSLFLIEMMKGAQGQGTILSRDGYKLLFNPLHESADGSTPSHSVFWFLEDDLIQHAGNDFGVVAKIEFSPKTNSGFVFITNSEMIYSPDGSGNLQHINRILNALKEYAY